jgi:ATP-binding cassette subfamily B multidrug efflux pump
MFDENVDKRTYAMKDGDLFRRLLAYAKPYWLQFIFVFVLLFVASYAITEQPLYIGQALDIVSVDGFDFSLIMNIVYRMILIIVIYNSFTYINTIILQRIGQSIIYTIRQEIFTHLENHDIAYLNSSPTGSFVTRVTNDTNILNEMFTSVIVSIIGSLFVIGNIIFKMINLDWRMALYVLITIPIIVVITFIFRIAARKAYRTQRRNRSKVNAFLAEHLGGMKIIQIFNQEKRKFDEFDELNTQLKYSFYKQILIFGIFRPAMYFMYIAAALIVFYVGGVSVITGLISVGVVVTMHAFVGNLFEPINQLAEVYNVLQSAFASAERIFGIMDTPPQIVDEEDGIELVEMRGEIEFKDVWFKYVEDEWVLKGVSFKVLSKESVAFVGATGSGKTTILSLIVRNYDIQQGEILIDGINIKRIKKSTLRRFVGQMLQDVFMFSGTIESNIKLLSKDITDNEMIEACKYVNAHQFIDKLDHKYQEPVRERGNNFSSGQRQLISFARTIVHNPSVMILDEATSNIDTETEQLIQDSLSKMMGIGTMLIVAHRLSTIQHVDNIIVLSKGEILEMGNHQELLKQKGHYYNLYRIQYQDQH